jgi:hypothetical protein
LRTLSEEGEAADPASHGGKRAAIQAEIARSDLRMAAGSHAMLRRARNHCKARELGKTSSIMRGEEPRIRLINQAF